MNFDNVIQPDCANPSSPAAQPHCGSTGGSGGGNGGGDDPRCADPAFAQAHPDICPLSPRLIVKPDYTMREVGGACQFKAYLWSNGTETELTDGVIWRTSNGGVALVGAGSGNAIAVAPGTVTISAEWGVLSAFAQFEVVAVGECANQGHTYVLLFDTSKSVTSPFSTLYQNRLAFAKEVARKFVDTVDVSKDKVAVMTFSTGGVTVLEESADVTAIKNAINGITATQDSTNIQAGLEAAYALEVENRRVVLVFTDGENKAGDDPVTYANNIRGANVIFAVVGLRASGQNFRRLESIADGGFFVNALPTNQLQVADWVSGFKSYLCSGSCAPAGNVVLGVGELNFENFTNWDVVSGNVDLIGGNDGGIPLFDFLPGNGLYLDLAGSSDHPNPDLGVLKTKDSFVWEAGKTYKVQLVMAGNQREQRSPDVVELTIWDKNGDVIKSVDFSITKFNDNFKPFETTFVPTADQAGGGGGKIQVRQKSIPADTTGVYGTLLDRVTILNVTDGLTVFDDNFDSENAQFIPPPCGPTEGYGYCYDYGCLETPLPAQTSDPSPLSDLEGGGSTGNLFSSTKTVTVECPGDASKTATATRTATSDISQAAADAAATQAAREAATEQLDCSREFRIGEMINYLPCVAGKTGYAATGKSPDDIWVGITEADNRLTLTTGEKVSARLYLNVSEAAASSPTTQCRSIDDPSRDLLMRRWFEALFDIALVIKNLPVGTYSVFVYAHGEHNADNARVSVYTGDLLDDGTPVGGITSYGELDTENGLMGPPWAQGNQYVVFNFAIDADNPHVVIECDPKDNVDGMTFINGFQLKRVT